MILDDNILINDKKKSKNLTSMKNFHLNLVQISLLGIENEIFELMD